jgi:hypothetical protein
MGQSFSDDLNTSHETYKEKTITNRRFKHKDIQTLVQRLDFPFKKEKIGTSLEGNPIYLVKIGNGKTKVLLWSQMHGDEPTATMALMDIFNFFSKSDRFDKQREKILSELTLYFIPMLNPDGANRFMRRTALGIDLNRDAKRLQTPEGQLLKQIRDEINADWGFNLHDQSRYYSVGKSNKTATISFLAPAYNYEKDINPIRKRAMQQIGLLNKTLQQLIPGHVARYNDDFEPRAFGDNIQKWGTSTILIESGGYKGDPEKQFIRKINFIALLSSFHQIANKTYADESLAEYNSLPFNARRFQELIIKNASYSLNGINAMIDIGFKRNEIQFDEDRQFYYRSYIADLGDLSTYTGYEVFDAKGYEIIPGKIYPKTLRSWKKVKKLNIKELHQQGYTDISVKGLTNEDKLSKLPIGLISKDGNIDYAFHLGNNPSFFLAKNGKKEILVINGRLHYLP